MERRTGPGTAARDGLEDVVAAETRLSSVDGARGELVIAGYAVEELAPRAEIEETMHLLWHGSLPTRSELAELRARLAAARALPPAVLALLREAARRRVPPVAALRMAVAACDVDAPEPENAGAEALRRSAERVAARVPVMVATYARLLRGEEPLPLRADLDAAANYLYLLGGKEPRPDRVRALHTYWNTVVDHGLNASTFTARVIVSTRSDLVSAVAGAVGALKGPLHGGAPGPALDMVLEIGEPERAEPHVRALLERGERLMGFGHRVYRVRDPRADVLAAAVERLERTGDFQRLYALARHVEAVALRLLAAHKPGRNLSTNVELYTALLLRGLGLPAELFTPTFAAGRVVGWIAHCFEQLATGRLIRPASAYVGDTGRRWVPLEERSGATARAG